VADGKRQAYPSFLPSSRNWGQPGHRHSRGDALQKTLSPALETLADLVEGTPVDAWSPITKNDNVYRLVPSCGG
jgi:hypothetical protein